MRLSYHGLQRWCERFPDLILGHEWDKATRRRTSKRLLNQLRKHTAIVKGHQYRVSPNGVVFVVAGDDRVVTVFRMKE